MAEITSNATGTKNAVTFNNHDRIQPFDWDTLVGQAATLDYVDLYCFTYGAVGGRIAVYQGGTITDPNGASLIAEWVIGDVTTGRWERFTASSESISASGPIHVNIKNDDTGFNLYYSTNAGDADDADDYINITGQTGEKDDTVAFPDPMDNTGATTGAAWYGVKVGYTLSGGGGGASGFSRIYDITIGPGA